MSNISLTNDQDKALSNFRSFIDDPESRIFILKGYAGTGKTTLTGEFMEELENRKISFSLLASTGRAAKILANATKHEAKTVHGEIYKFIDLNQDLEKIAKEREERKVDSTGQLLLNFELTSKDIDPFSDTQYYLVDEASMISDKTDPTATQAMFGTGRLLQDLLSFDPNGKFIFIGDVCQLPPITQSFSPALNADYFLSEYGIKAYESELTKIVRQEAGNDIIIAAQKLRNLYYHPQDWKWARFPLKNHKNIHLVSTQAELYSKYLDVVKEQGFNAGTILCYSNRQCNTLAQLLRPSFGLRSSKLEKGDLLLVTQNNMVSGLMNGDLVTVEDITSREHRAGMTFIHVTVKEMFSQLEFSLPLIEEVLYSNFTNITQAQQKELFIDYYYRMKAEHISPKSEYFKKRMWFDPYLNALRAVYGYALTCHKAQGGEWDYVFLDVPKNLGLQERPAVYQWVYTAVTRARKELYIVDGFWLM